MQQNKVLHFPQWIFFYVSTQMRQDGWKYAASSVEGLHGPFFSK